MKKLIELCAKLFFLPTLGLVILFLSAILHTDMNMSLLGLGLLLNGFAIMAIEYAYDEKKKIQYYYFVDNSVLFTCTYNEKEISLNLLPKEGEKIIHLDKEFIVKGFEYRFDAETSSFFIYVKLEEIAK